ncbi:olfactory receptor 10AG1-like [Trichosurus vulpecula]|uniref:olfactory receptor 10AG1-like n=1 Tax=Trichosurus vulpecula TaxID=9337 RepID=UPI00186B36A8|nr:olfactory receptor 10AG1-like [Trichosurus vulpecula]
MENTRKLMEANLTDVVEFILLGFSDLPKLQGLLFGIFLVVYMSILIGNGLIIIITKTDRTLQTPMYFFLGNFSFLEICYTSVTLPRLLWNLGTQKRNISVLACAVQLCFFLTLAITECSHLAIMAYDRYVAICKPLYYPLIMNHKFCVHLVFASWIISIVSQIGQTCLIFSLHFCFPKLNHIFCDMAPLLKAACGDTYMNELSISIAMLIFVVTPFILILLSYFKIIVTVMKLKSAQGRSKAFSVCSSHLVVVLMYFGTGIVMYLRPKSEHSANFEKITSLLYLMITPVFNPLIYSLRNNDVIVALKKLILKWQDLQNK